MPINDLPYTPETKPPLHLVYHNQKKVKTGFLVNQTPKKKPLVICKGDKQKTNG